MKVEATEALPCDVCGQPLALHSTGAGIPICPGVYSPGYRNTLGKRIDELEARVEQLERERDEASRKHNIVEAELTANERRIGAFQRALSDAVSTNTENCRQRDAALDALKAIEEPLHNLIELARPHFSDEVQMLGLREAHQALAQIDAITEGEGL